MSRLFLLESAVIPRRYVLSRRLLRVRSPEWGKLLLKRKRRFALLYLAAGYRCGVQIIGVDAGGYDHDRAYRVVEHGLRGGAQQHAGEATPAARSHHDEVDRGRELRQEARTRAIKDVALDLYIRVLSRSEERRVGKEGRERSTRELWNTKKTKLD